MSEDLVIKEKLKLELKIVEVENGYLVLRSPHRIDPFESASWVAQDIPALLNLIEKLAKEERFNVRKL